MRYESPGMTLQATALVHEAYARMVDQTRASWQNRAHFLAVASRVMRRVLVDHARSRGRLKRGGDHVRDRSTTSSPRAADGRGHAARARRRASPPRGNARRRAWSRCGSSVETQEESASALGVTDRTVRRHWDFARAWLYRELGEGTAGA
ncbi:MAG: ECF-type sigma factor [Candidatus Eisenbacteria bacterium]